MRNVITLVIYVPNIVDVTSFCNHVKFRVWVNGVQLNGVLNGVHLLLNAELNAIVFSKLNAELNANRKTPERKVNAAFRASVQV